MSAIFGATLLLLGAAAAAYFLAPGAVLAVVMALARRMAGLRLRAVQIDGHRIPYLDGGRGEPLLLLHGFAANKDHWTVVARLLTPHYRVIAPDLPGFGDSTRDPSARYGLDEQLDRLAAFTTALGLTRFHLGGNSMGGYLAAMYAARYPAQVDSLWLLAPAGARSAQNSEMLDLLEAGDNPLLVTDSASFARLTALCFHTAPPMPAQFIKPLLARALAETPFNAKIFDDMFSEPRALDDLSERIPTPTLLVWGDSDRVLHPSGLDILRRVFSTCECVLMPRMGHVPMVERPSDVVVDLLRFHAHRTAH